MTMPRFLDIEAHVPQKDGGNRGLCHAFNFAEVVLENESLDRAWARGKELVLDLIRAKVGQTCKCGPSGEPVVFNCGVIGERF